MIGTKEILSNAFLALLEEKPYNKITVNNIVDRCHVNRNTFYYHFQDIPALTEYTVYAWADSLFKDEQDLSTPLSCILPFVEKCQERKTAILHIYRSVQRESFIRNLNRYTDYIIRKYLNLVAKDYIVPAEDLEVLIIFYKCTLSGILLYWMDQGMNYDLSAFSKKIFALFGPAGSNALFSHAVSRKS